MYGIWSTFAFLKKLVLTPSGSQRLGATIDILTTRCGEPVARQPRGLLRSEQRGKDRRGTSIAKLLLVADR